MFILVLFAVALMTIICMMIATLVSHIFLPLLIFIAVGFALFLAAAVDSED